MQMSNEKTENNETNNAQSKGGLARSEALSAEERKQIAKRAAKARWEAAKKAATDPDRMPEAICGGELEIGDVTIECYVLDDMRRVIHKRGMAKALGMKSTGGNAFLKAMNRKGLGSAISEKVWEKINNPLIFKPLSGDPGHGYE